MNHVESVESPPVLRSLLTSLGQMKYLHTPLVDAILTWYSATLPLVPQYLIAHCCRYGRKCVDGDTEMGAKDMTTLVMTLATLNHAPVQHARLLDHVSARLKDVADTLPEHVWLDTVWSLTVLNKVTSEQLQSVLNPIFYNVILCKYKVSESIQRNCCIEQF